MDPVSIIRAICILWFIFWLWYSFKRTYLTPNSDYDKSSLPSSIQTITMPHCMPPKPSEEETTKFYSRVYGQESLDFDSIIRTEAYLLAMNDGFKKDSQDYWYEAETIVRGN